MEDKPTDDEYMNARVNQFTTRFFAIALALLAVMQFSAMPVAFSADGEVSQAEEFQTIEWISIMPKDDLEALMNPPDYIAQIVDGSSEDNMDTLKELAKDNEQIQRFQSALSSSKIVEDYLGKKIRIPGFIVPLEGEEQIITEFFIVPFFGACLHMPPPPPNQIIHVKYGEGVELVNLYDPFWFEGTLSAKMISNDMGASAYAMVINSIYPHQE